MRCERSPQKLNRASPQPRPRIPRPPHTAASRADHSPEQKSSASFDAELSHFYEQPPHYI
jgi:hypothetical protein